MDFFARLSEQAKDLWARPAGKWLVGIVGLFILIAASASLLLTRPTYVPLGKFEGEDASEVVTKLRENNIEPRVNGTTIEVREENVNSAQLLLTELNLDPTTSAWSAVPWSNMSSWMSTSFDKRQEWKEQTEANLARAIMALSAVNKARVFITIPVQERLFTRDEEPPKATVIVDPKPGRVLTYQNVAAVKRTVAGAIERLDPDSVVVVDASSNQELSSDPDEGKEVTTGQLASDLFTVQQKFQEKLQNDLTASLERVVGPGNVTVMVTPKINWEQVTKEAVDYVPSGPNNTGVVLSRESSTESSDGTPAPTGGLSGTTPNAEAGGPTYPAAPPLTGSISSEQEKEIINYLVSEVRTKSDKPGGAIEELAVGVLINSTSLKNAADEAGIATVVAQALGSTAQVAVQAVAFDDRFRDIFEPPTVVQPTTLPYNWLAVAAGILLALAAIAFLLQMLRNRRQVLEPVFVGPEATLMGGIPINDFDTSAAAIQPEPGERRLPETPEELAALPPEEIALLGDEFLQQIGVDPAKVRMKEKVEKVARGNPEMVANLIKAWIVDE